MEKNDVHIQKLTLMQPTEWRQEQLDDDNISSILWAKEQDARPGWTNISYQSREPKLLWSQWDSLRIEHGTLYRVCKSENGQNEYSQVMMPRSSVLRILHKIYDQVSGRDLGITKTVAKLWEWFYWPPNEEDVEDWIRRCIACAATKGP